MTINKKKPGKYLKVDGCFIYNPKTGKRILETRTTKRYTKVESDWRNYSSSCGSNKKLQEKIETLLFQAVLLL